jgi:hypothetical protein
VSTDTLSPEDRTVAYRKRLAATSYPVTVHYGPYVREQIDGDACAICFRDFKRGEKTEPYVAPDSDANLYRHVECTPMAAGGEKPVTTLGQRIAADVRALADLIEACPELAEEIQHVLNLMSVRALTGREAGLRAIGHAAEEAGHQYIPQPRSHQSAADVVIGTHVRVALYVPHGTESVALMDAATAARPETAGLR